MTIEGIGAVDPIGKETQIRKNSDVESSKKVGDEVKLSSESRIKGDLLLATEQVNNTPDIRSDLVARAKEKLSDPNYLNDPAILDTVAKRITDIFLG